MGRLHAIVNSSADIYIPMCINSSFIRPCWWPYCTVLILTESHSRDDTLAYDKHWFIGWPRALYFLSTGIEIYGATKIRTESFSAFTVPVLDGTIVSKISVCVLHGNTIFNITFNFAFAHSELCKLNLIRGNFVCSFRSLLIVIFDGRKVF